MTVPYSLLQPSLVPVWSIDQLGEDPLGPDPGGVHLSVGVGRVAAPAVIGKPLHHPGPQGLRVDVIGALQKVVLKITYNQGNCIREWALNTGGDLMDRDTVLTILSQNRPLLQKHRVKNLRLFGSVLRGEAEVGSDVDFLAEFEPAAPIGMFEFSRLRRDLSRLLGCKVDLVTPDALHRLLKDEILRESIRAA
jgi:hypothetical protein